MSDHNENALHAAVKALTQVVAPAVDRANPLAVEQLRLVSMYLEFLAQQRPHERRLAWTDLRLQAELASAVTQAIEPRQGELGARLLDAVGRAQDMLRTPVAPVAAWERAHRDLAELLSEAIAEAEQGDAAAREALEALVVERAHGQLMLHRVWFRAYGFEARPEALPSLQDVLAGAPDI